MGVNMSPQFACNTAIIVQLYMDLTLAKEQEILGPSVLSFDSYLFTRMWRTYHVTISIAWYFICKLLHVATVSGASLRPKLCTKFSRIINFKLYKKKKKKKKTLKTRLLQLLLISSFQYFYCRFLYIICSIYQMSKFHIHVRQAKSQYTLHNLQNITLNKNKDIDTLFIIKLQWNVALDAKYTSF